MKTKKLITTFVVSLLTLVFFTTCKKDNFIEDSGICPLPKVEFTVQVSSNPTDGGITIGDGTFTKDTIVTVSATPNAEYTFTNWTEDTTVVSTDPNYTFTLIKNTVLVGNFIPVPQKTLLLCYHPIQLMVEQPLAVDRLSMEHP